MNTKKKNRVVCLLFACLLLGGFLSCVLLPKAEYSESERRGLAPMPELSGNTVWSGRFMTDFESYTVDAFPFRDWFRTVKAMTANGIFQRQDNHGIYLYDGYLAAVEYPLNEASLNRAAERFRYLYEKYLDESNHVYLSVIPDKNCYLANDSHHLSLDYLDFESKMKERSDFASYISIADLLDRDDYYRTDTHWRQEKITDVADRLAQAMGATLSARYQQHTLEHEFRGVYYGQAALPIQPDTLSYLTNQAMEHCTVYDWQNGKDISVYDMDRAVGRDPYEMFLSGSLSLITIKNPDASANKKLVLFRDSFGSSIAPLLISGYSEITLVDIRYIQPDFLGRFINFEGCDVLFLYSTLVLNNSETLK